MPVVIVKHRTSSVTGEGTKEYMKEDGEFTPDVTQAKDWITYIAAENQAKTFKSNGSNFFPEIVPLDRYKNLRP